VADAERLPGVTPAAVAILIGRLVRSREAPRRRAGSAGVGEPWPES
jgi:hypothetical protein